MIHVYLLHDEEDLSTMQAEQEKMAADDYNAINFGQSVLCWLPFDTEPTFPTLKDEMINNPASTINEDGYNNIETACKVKQENPSINTEGYTLKELVGIRAYSGLTLFQ